MENITDAATFARALDSPISESIKALLKLRRGQLLDGTDSEIGALAQFIVVTDAHDDIESIEAAAGYPIVTSRAFEWVLDHGGFFEAATVLDDSGYAVVLICPDTIDGDQYLMAALRELAEPAGQVTPTLSPSDHATTA